MKKYFSLLFALSLAASFNYAENLEETATRISLEEKDIVSEGFPKHRFDHSIWSQMLYFGCSFNAWTNNNPRPVSYNKHEHPQCQKILDFLKKYKEQLKLLDSEAQDLFDQVLEENAKKSK